MSNAKEIDRRQFAKGLIVATTSVAVTSSSSVARCDDKASNTEPKDATKPDNSIDRSELPPQELALLNILMQRYPSDHFDRPALRGIFSDLRGDVARGRILSEYPLKNSDEPGQIFRAYRGNDEDFAAN